MPELSWAREWTPLDEGEWNRPQPENVQGVDIVAFLSPYDVPEAVRGYYNEDDRNFVIEFKYIGGNEALKTAAKDKHVTLWVGRDSKRLRRIDVKAGSQEPKWVLQAVPEVDQAIDGLADERQLPPRTDNYQLAKRILERLFSTGPTTPADQLPKPT